MMSFISLLESVLGFGGGEEGGLGALTSSGFRIDVPDDRLDGVLSTRRMDIGGDCSCGVEDGDFVGLVMRQGKQQQAERLTNENMPDPLRSRDRRHMWLKLRKVPVAGMEQPEVVSSPFIFNLPLLEHSHLEHYRRYFSLIDGPTDDARRLQL